MATYADRLTGGVDYGTCGDAEHRDTPRQLKVRIEKLVQLFRAAQGRVVVHTGAGISTAAGISDFRGPQGIWTKQQEKLQREKKAGKEALKNKRRRGGEGTASLDGGAPDGSEGGSTTASDAPSAGKRVKLEHSEQVESSSPGVRAKNLQNDTFADVAASSGERDAVPVQQQQQQQQQEPTVGPLKQEEARSQGEGARATEAEVSSTASSSNNPFESAVPTLTHMALLQLLKEGHIAYISSQNVDGLHLRSGVPRNKLSELHGNMFMEKCESCHSEFFGDRDVGSVGLKPTGRKCEKCGGVLRDSLLDWNDALPDDDYLRAQQETRAADLSVCLGTSLRVHPACELPFMTQEVTSTKRRPGNVAIVNLQNTPFMEEADLVIHEYCDEVMKAVCDGLSVKIPAFPVPVSNTDQRASSVAQQGEPVATEP